MFKCHFTCELSLLSYHKSSELCAMLVPSHKAHTEFVSCGSRWAGISSEL